MSLAITYALSFTNLLNGLLSSFIETEKELVSVERINEYIETIPAEEENDGDEQKIDPPLLVILNLMSLFNHLLKVKLLRTGTSELRGAFHSLT